MPENKSIRNASPDSISENMYKLLFESSPVSLLITDPEGNILEANRWMLDELGYSSDEICSLQATDLYVESSERERIAAIIVKDFRLRNHEVRFKRKDGSSFVGLLNVDLIQRGDRVINLTSIRNITKQKEYEKVLGRDRRAYHIIADAALNSESVSELCNLVLSGLVNTLEFSIGSLCLLSEKENELVTVAWTGIGKDKIHERIHCDDKLLVAKAARERKPIFASDVQTIEDYEYFKERFDFLGIKSFISWPVVNAEENLVAVINIASHDIKAIGDEDLGFFETVSGMFAAALAQKQAEEELRESQELFQMFTDHMPGPVFIKNHESRVVYINRFMSEVPMTEDWVGKTNYELFPPETARKRTLADKKVLEEGPLEEIQTMRNLEGQPVTYRRLKFPIHREGKEPLIGGFSININEQVKAEEALRDARARAEFFTDLMAHDLNNIHQGVMASLELLLSEKDISPERRILAQNALDQIYRGVTLIANVRKFSKLGEGEADLSKMELADELLTAKQLVIQSFPKKKVEVNITGLQADMFVRADEFLRDAFFNILHNGVKFNPAETAQIDISVLSISEDDQEYFILEIEDHGPGIRDDQKEKVFTRFRGRTQRGSGIGLTLVKQIIDRYNGDVSILDRVKGDPTQGAKFIIRLPKSTDEE